MGLSSTLRKKRGRLQDKNSGVAFRRKGWNHVGIHERGRRVANPKNPLPFVNFGTWGVRFFHFPPFQILVPCDVASVILMSALGPSSFPYAASPVDVSVLSFSHPVRRGFPAGATFLSSPRPGGRGLWGRGWFAGVADLPHTFRWLSGGPPNIPDTSRRSPEPTPNIRGCSFELGIATPDVRQTNSRSPIASRNPPRPSFRSPMASPNLQRTNSRSPIAFRNVPRPSRRSPRAPLDPFDHPC